MLANNAVVGCWIAALGFCAIRLICLFGIAAGLSDSVFWVCILGVGV